MSLSEALARKVFSKPKSTDVPQIICRMNSPHERTYPIFLKNWETVRMVMKNGKAIPEISRNRHVKVEIDGTVFIDKTPNNELRLQRVTKPSVVKENRTRTNPNTGVEETFAVEVTYPPKFEILENNLFNKSLVRQIAEELKQMKDAPEQEYAEEEEIAQAEPEDTAHKPLPVTRALPQNQTGKSLKRRGRPPLRPQAELA